MFGKYEDFDLENPKHMESLKNHREYCEPGTIKIIIDERDQPERSKREDNEDPVMKFIAPICDSILELR